MGHCKELLENPMVAYRGSYICSSCINDPDLKSYIKDHAEKEDGCLCEICGRNIKVMPLYDFLEHIKECLNTVYDEAANFVPYDSHEGGYQYPTIHTYDLVHYELFNDEKKEFKNILETILGDTLWSETCHEDNEISHMIYSWEQFKYTIIKKKRFTFLLQEIYEYSHDTRTVASPSGTLKMLEGVINDSNLFKMIKSGTTFYRARSKNTKHHTPKRQFEKVDELCPPPAEKAKEGRMNPHGIPMFYCSACKKTAELEVADENLASITIAHFKNLKDLMLLDLTKLPETPSIFSEEACLRIPIGFLNDFVKDISQKTNKTESGVVLEYIPTQIITEYFRYFLKTLPPENRSIDGICYPSTRRPGGVNYVMFYDRNSFKGVPPEDTQNAETKNVTPCFEMTKITFNKFSKNKKS